MPLLKKKTGPCSRALGQFKMALWFVMHDSKPRDPRDPETSMQLIAPEEAGDYNEKGFGVFWTVNDFKGRRRVTEELTKINSWAIDIDNMDKRLLLEKLSKAPLPPSRIVETKSGLHVYWFAKAGATPDAFRSIVDDRLCYFFEGDKKAKDLCRVLRVPGFLHMKDPANPFFVRILYETKNEYSEEEMIQEFKLPRIHELRAVQKQELQVTLKPQGGDFWEKVWSLNQMNALQRLSGHEVVRGEIYTFKRNRNNFNIWVNNVSTNNFIDSDFKIGSSTGGGPTVANWLHYFGYQWRDVARFLKTIFPELEDQAPAVDPWPREQKEMNVTATGF